MILACANEGFRPWLDTSGLKVTSIIMAMMCLVFNMSFLVFTWKGKAMRVWTSKKYLKEAREGSRLHPWTAAKQGLVDE